MAVNVLIDYSFNEFGDCLVLGRFRIRLLLSYDRVLKLFDYLGQEREVWDESVLDFGLGIVMSRFSLFCLRFVIGDRLKLKAYVLGEIVRLLGGDVSDDALSVTIVENVEERGKVNNVLDGERLLCFKRDFGYIYSGFLQDYGIDLFKERGKLHYRKFVELLGGISEGTKLARIVAIRAMKVPKASEASFEEIRRVRGLKRAYCLAEEVQDKTDVLSSGIAELFGIGNCN